MNGMRSSHEMPQPAGPPGRNLGWLVVQRGSGSLCRGRIIDLPAQQNSFVIEHDDLSNRSPVSKGAVWTWRAVINYQPKDNQFYLSVPPTQEALGAIVLDGGAQSEAVRVGEEPVLLRDGARIRMGRTVYVFKTLYST